MPVNNYLVPHLTCTLTAAIVLSGHHADMLLFIKHNHHHHRVLGFFVVIAMLYTSIGVGIGIARGQYYWILGAFLGIVLTLLNTEYGC